ncbi:LAQU0S04e07778g1_1 [Lachancea quebecensis]|uniref:L-2-hydroxyglutarate dehydrogenase, mitochondrial n=1 Tax=Lachancea quebecensis TaxID=1654605 RepID=A0A0P1KSV9_9SACH|nr:LAQU0S04e07778g1_1 [Lachancea quebecensis]
MLKFSNLSLLSCQWRARCIITRAYATSFDAATDYSHAVIGGGVVGLSVAHELSKRSGNKVLLIEKNPSTGLETSSRNSEVIHAGLYYPVHSLKTKLCLEGSKIIYNELAPFRTGVNWLKCGKWIVAQTDADDAYLESMYYKAKNDLDLPVEMISANKTKWIEPAIHVGRSVLNSPTTGIIDSHSLMQYLLTGMDNNGAELAIGTELIDMAYDHGKGYSLLCKSTLNNSDETVQIRVENVINAAGLQAHKVANMLLPKNKQKVQYFGKGSYYTLSGSAPPPVRRLVYSVPPKNEKSLGTHLTIDLMGQLRFGPDLEYVESPSDYKVSCSNLKAAYEAICRYYPHIQLEDLQPAYSGIRPKLAGPGDKGFKDFYISEEEGLPGFVNMLGIESPGLTASLAIGRHVYGLYHS